MPQQDLENTSPVDVPSGAPAATDTGLAALIDLTPEADPGHGPQEQEAADGAPAPRRRRRALWALAGAAALLAAVGASGYAYASHYADLALPGTTVAGTDVAGMTHDEVVAAVQSAADSTTVTVTGDVTSTASLSDLGATVDATATADAALARSASVVQRFRALVSPTAVPVSVTSDATTAQRYADALVPADATLARDARVVLAQDGLSFTVSPSATGKTLDATALADAASTAASSLTSGSIDLTFTDATPTVTDADAQAVADAANLRLAQDVTVTSADGDSTFTADTATKASWLTVAPGKDGKPTLSADTTAITTWVTAQAAEVSSEPVTGKRNVNEAGQTVAVVVEAVDGRSVSNTDAVVKAIADALTGTGDAAITPAFEMTTTAATWEDRKVATGAEALVYQAAPGEKWVDVDLSAKTVTAYEGASVVRGPVYIVDGAAATPTVTGTFHVYLKYDSQTMRGENADGSKYVTEDVPWVTYWTGSFAFHGAPWRSSFGYSGSHGCINMPVGEARWIHSWTDMGTTVVSHY